MKRINLPIREELHSQAKIISVIKKVTLNEYLRLAIKRAIEKDKSILKKLLK